MTLYRTRFYREYMSCAGTFNVKAETSDLYIKADCDLSGEALTIVNNLRSELRNHINRQPEFLTSLVPVPVLSDVADIVKEMYSASEAAGTGPMASVAGAIAEYTGRFLLSFSREIIVENGGDIFIDVCEDIIVSVFAGNSPFSGKLALKIKHENTPAGICTSSGRVGHSLSFGKADSVTVISSCAPLADAVATGACNIVKTETDMEKAAEYAMGISGISGILIVMDDAFCAKGDVELAVPDAM